MPEHSDVVKISKSGRQLGVTCEDGSAFSFPSGDCLVLPVAHTTAEEFSHYFWGRLAERLTPERLLERGVEFMKVFVWEGPNQSAAFGRAVPRELPERHRASGSTAGAAPPCDVPAAKPLLPRVVFLTGASRGYGSALAAAFVREAAQTCRRLQLMLTARDEPALQSVAATCGSGGAAVGVHRCPLDFLQPMQLREKLEGPFRELEKHLRQLGEASADGVELLLVHNAGTLGPLSYSQDIGDEDVQAAMSVNVTSFAILNDAFLQRFTSSAMAELRVHVRIVNISSLLAVEAFPSWSLYATGKAARDMAMRCVAKDAQAQGLDVRTLSWAPGPMRTAMTEQILASCADAGVLENFKKMDSEGSFVPVDTSADKLMKLLAEDTYESGAHIDYFDV